MLRKPVLRVSMIAGDFLLITSVVANDIFLRQVINFAKMRTKLCGFFINCIEVRDVGQVVFADFKADMCIICLLYTSDAADE